MYPVGEHVVLSRGSDSPCLDAVSRQRGSHIVLRRGSSVCVVPDHREIKTGTLSGVLKQAGVSRDEFLSALAGV